MYSLSFKETFFYNGEFFFFFSIVFFFLFLLYMKFEKAVFYFGQGSYSSVNILRSFSILVLVLEIVIVFQFFHKKCYFFNELLVSSDFIVLVKILVLFFSLFIFFFSYNYLIRERIFRSFEYFFILLFSLFSIFILISVNELIILYLVIEVQSLTLYMLASSKQNSVLSVEAGLKYFVLGSLSSGFLLYGTSLLYSFGASTKIIDFRNFFLCLDLVYTNFILVVVSVFFFLVPFFFKISVVPFHTWTPDVYDGSPTLITFFFSVVPKFAIICLLFRFFMDGLFFMVNFKYVFFILTVLSLLLGAFGGLGQVKIKRLLAFSSINNIGFLMLGFMLFLGGSFVNSVVYSLIYFLVYFILSLSVFTVVLNLRYYSNFLKMKNIFEYSTLIDTHFFIVLAFVITLFSFIGIPPLSGFFAKFFLFRVLMDSLDYFYLVFFGILASVLASFYYLRIIRIALFKRFSGFVFLAPIEYSIYLIFMLTIYFNKEFFDKKLFIQNFVINIVESSFVFSSSIG